MRTCSGSWSLDCFACAMFRVNASGIEVWRVNTLPKLYSKLFVTYNRGGFSLRIWYIVRYYFMKKKLFIPCSNTSADLLLMYLCNGKKHIYVRYNFLNFIPYYDIDLNHPQLFCDRRSAVNTNHNNCMQADQISQVPVNTMLIGMVCRPTRFQKCQ